MTKWVYGFGGETTEGNATMRNLLGGKGANLAEMACMGLPVPPGFTITTEACTYFYENECSYPSKLREQMEQAVSKMEEAMGAKFGDPENPLLLSVRSGARVSMPGMMDSVLNMGLNDETVEGLAKRAGDERFAWDCYRRFIQMYSDVVLGIPYHDFEAILDSYKKEHGCNKDTDVTAQGWKDIVSAYKAHVEEELENGFPEAPLEQLWGGIGAVFKSWNLPRAMLYRKMNHIPDDWGTAVNVQAMVFGNMGENSATGVAFTRDPSTGDNYFYGEYLVNAQGEDVVAGIRTPQSLTRIGKERDGLETPAMEEIMPEMFKKLNEVRQTLEHHYREMQDIEFTVQQGKLYMLQTRTGKRTAGAAIKIAVDMVEEGLITKEEALLRIDADMLDQLLHPTLDPAAERDVIGHGLSASPGAASGRVVFSTEEAEKRAEKGEKVILVRVETSPDDIHGMYVAQGILTTRGGMTSHAAVVARGMGRPCVAGAGSLRIDYAGKRMYAGRLEIEEGDLITIDGSTGEVMRGEIPTLKPSLSGDFSTVMEWADTMRRMAVRANAETPEDARTARDFGAQGIGLCRTEHMFFDPGRIQKVREMIFVENGRQRRDILAKLLPEQRADFKGLFRIMDGLPVTIRLLDPPLHEFLPHTAEDIALFARNARLSEEKVCHRLDELRESNPMLGHRGCRLGITYPEIYEMQARAIIEAAIMVVREGGKAIIPEIMIPLIATRKELAILREAVQKTAETVMAEQGTKIDYQVGTMIELPRSCLVADDIAREAAFFSFGTNDLTQTALGISRDDASSFLPFYVERGLFKKDPFVSLDQKGVGQLIKIAVEKGHSVRSDIKLGICGEHGGDPDSIDFCERAGLTYVSCSAYRVPIARLAAAQATIRAKLRAEEDKKKVV